MGSKSLENTIFGLAASNYPYFDPSTNSLLPKMAERSKRWAAIFGQNRVKFFVSLNWFIIMSHAKKKLKSKNYCFLDLNLSCFGVRGPPWKIFKEKILNVENKSCSTIISEQLCQKTKNSHLLSFRDKGGPNFQRKYTNLGIFRPKEARGRSKTSNMDSEWLITPILIPDPTLYSKKWQNAPNDERPTFTQKFWLWGSRSPFRTPTR